MNAAGALALTGTVFVLAALVVAAFTAMTGDKRLGRWGWISFVVGVLALAGAPWLGITS